MELREQIVAEKLSELSREQIDRIAADLWITVLKPCEGMYRALPIPCGIVQRRQRPVIGDGLDRSLTFLRPELRRRFGRRDARPITTQEL